MEENLESYDWLESEERLIHEENSLILSDREHGKKAEIGFYSGTDSFGNPFLFLDSINSYKPGEGNFSRLFAHLKSKSMERRLEYFLLEVDYSNDRAIEIYESLGFYSLGDRDFISENTDRILLRKDLLFDGE